MHRQPSIEEVEDVDTIQPRKAFPKKASHIIELADGSEDDDDIPGLATSVEDSDESEKDEEAPAESADAELSTHPTKICLPS